MGCDIHGWVEKKVGEKWIAVRELEGQAEYRNYERFAALAGVRGEGPEPRGIPPDVSETTGYHIGRWDTDGHSHSWLPLTEAATIFLQTRGTPAGDDWESRYPGSAYFHIDEPDDSYRLVFWFDN